MEPTMFFIFLILSLLVYSIGLRMYKSSINPLFCVVDIFMVALCLFYAADFVDHNLSSKTITIYTLGLVSYTVGLLFTAFFRSKRMVLITDYIIPEEIKGVEYAAHKKITSIAYFVISFCFAITFVYILFYVGLASYVKNVFISNKEMLATSSVFTFTELIKKTLLIFTPMILSFIVKYKERIKTGIFFIAISFLLTLTYNRVMFFYLLIINACALYFLTLNHRKRKVKFRTKIILVAILILFVSFFMNTETLFNKAVRNTGMIGKYSINNDQLTMILYFMGTIKSSDIYINSNMYSPPLAATFRYIYEMFGVRTSNYVEAPFVNIPIRYNTGVAQFYLFREGGYLWLILGSMIIGLIVSGYYEDYRKYNTSDKVITVSFLSLCTMMSIRGYLPMYLEFWIPLFVLIYVRKTMRKARKIDYISQNQGDIDV